MYRTILKRCLLLALSIISISCKSEIPILEAKNLYNVVNPLYGQCSPIEGMAWFKSGMIEKMYRYGDQNDATIKLIKEFFYLHPDGTFDATRVPAQLKGTGKSAAFFSPRIIATIINWLEKNDTEDKIKKLKKEITDSGYIKKFIQDHTEFPKEGSFVRNLQKIFNLICDSHLESIRATQNYQLYTTHSILLSLLWKKSNSKNDFIEYFKSFFKLDDTIIDSKYEKNFVSQLNNTYTINELVNFRLNLTFDTEDRMEVVLSNYELALVVLIWQPEQSQLSQAVAQASQKIRTNTRGIFETFDFSDCGETSLLNFFILTLYDPQRKIFNIGYLNKVKPSQKLKEFFEKYKSTDLSESNSVRNDWIQTVSELPNVTYKWPKIGTIQEGGRCEIKGEGTSQILNSLRSLIGVNSFDELVDKLSREDFILTYKTDKPNEQFQALTFYLNGKPYFVWHMNPGHFYITNFDNNENLDSIPNLGDLIIETIREEEENNEQIDTILLILLNKLDNKLHAEGRAPFPFILEFLQNISPYLNKTRLILFKKLYLEHISNIIKKPILGQLPTSTKNKVIETFVNEEKARLGN